MGSTPSSNETHFGSNATLAASIVGGKIKLGDTGLCLAHEDNYVSTNRVKAVACYGGSDVLWTINGGQIKSYEDASCLDWHVYFISNPRVNMYKCYDGGYFSNPARNGHLLDTKALSGLSFIGTLDAWSTRTMGTYIWSHAMQRIPISCGSWNKGRYVTNNFVCLCEATRKRMLYVSSLCPVATRILYSLACLSTISFKAGYRSVASAYRSMRLSVASFVFDDYFALGQM